MLPPPVLMIVLWKPFTHIEELLGTSSIDIMACDDFLALLLSKENFLRCLVSSAAQHK